jgi:hypothetical protein
VVSFTPRPLYPQRKSPWYQLDRRLDGPQSPVWWNSSPSKIAIQVIHILEGSIRLKFPVSPICPSTPVILRTLNARKCVLKQVTCLLSNPHPFTVYDHLLVSFDDVTSAAETASLKQYEAVLFCWLRASAALCSYESEWRKARNEEKGRSSVTRNIDVTFWMRGPVFGPTQIMWDLWWSQWYWPAWDPFRIFVGKPERKKTIRRSVYR